MGLNGETRQYTRQLQVVVPAPALKPPGGGGAKEKARQGYIQEAVVNTTLIPQLRVGPSLKLWIVMDMVE